MFSCSDSYSFHGSDEAAFRNQKKQVDDFCSQFNCCDDSNAYLSNDVNPHLILGHSVELNGCTQLASVSPESVRTHPSLVNSDVDPNCGIALPTFLHQDDLCSLSQISDIDNTEESIPISLTEYTSDSYLVNVFMESSNNLSDTCEYHSMSGKVAEYPLFSINAIEEFQNFGVIGGLVDFADTLSSSGPIEVREAFLSCNDDGSNGTSGTNGSSGSNEFNESDGNSGSSGSNSTPGDGSTNGFTRIKDSQDPCESLNRSGCQGGQELSSSDDFSIINNSTLCSEQFNPLTTILLSQSDYVRYPMLSDDYLNSPSSCFSVSVDNYLESVDHTIKPSNILSLPSNSPSKDTSSSADEDNCLLPPSVDLVCTNTSVIPNSNNSVNTVSDFLREVTARNRNEQKELKNPLKNVKELI